jgi:hypothetical protein
MRFLLILIPVLALLIIADGGVMLTSLCQVPPFEGMYVCSSYTFRLSLCDSGI